MTNATYKMRVFREADGYHWCDDSSPALDARGKAWPTKRDATRAAVEHFTINGVPAASVTVVNGDHSMARQLGAHASRG